MEALIGKTPDELRSLALAEGLPAYAGRQIAEWLYRKRVGSIDSMTNISAANREKLKQKYSVGRAEPLSTAESADGARKYLFDVGDNRTVEAVFIPDRDRATLCVSSQAGCRMGCRFCMTGRQGFSGQLTADQIINQLMSVPEAETLTNVVFMGMGEPMDNIDQTLKALTVLTSEAGFGWSPKRITVSTVGLLPAIQRFVVESQCHIAISLHSPFADERAELVPAERKWPIAKTIDFLAHNCDFSHQRRLSFEYIMFGGLNDSDRHARAVADLLSRTDCRVNLIKFHPTPDSGLPATDPDRMTAFRDSLTAKGVFATIRASRGEDIMAACGMLAATGKTKKHNTTE